MKKKELLRMRKLTATPSMISSAMADKVHTQGRYSWGDTYGYQIGRYLRCTEEQDILKVAVFATEDLRAGGKFPRYEIYLDAQKGDFITYDCIQQKWRKAKANMLPWPDYMYYSSGNFVSKTGDHLIRKHLNTKQGGYEGIVEFQLRMQEHKLKQRHKRETDPWDMDLAQTKPLPKDWNRWVNKVGIRENFIFYQYKKRGAKTGYCSHCERDVPIQHPKHNKAGVCPRCKKRITYKAIGKMGSFFTSTDAMYLIQRCDVGFMIRQFEGYRYYKRGEFQNPHISCYEVRRVLYDESAKPLRSYYWGPYRQQYCRWNAGGFRSANSYYQQKGRIYGKSLPTLFKNELRETGLQFYLGKNPIIDPEVYLAYYDRVPYLEKMMKANLPVLVKECFSSYEPYQRFFRGATETSLIKAMGIDAPRIKRLRESERGIGYLHWLRYEKKHGVNLEEDLITWLYDRKLKPDDFNFLNDCMSMVQIRHYICRQMQENQKDFRWVINTWVDTLSMAKKLQKDLSDPYVFRPADLHGRHQEYVLQINAMSDELLAQEQEKLFPKVKEICASIQDLYSYTDKKYMIIVPKDILEIIREGKAQEHCLGKGGRYLERIEKRESYILFLRKTSNPKKAYYTLEVEPDGTIRQKRTSGDVQRPDLLPAMKFLREWQRVVAQRLTGKERTLALQSKKLREEEFADMKKSNTIIYTGALRGQRLLDVLLADLMENEEVAAASMPIAA